MLNSKSFCSWYRKFNIKFCSIISICLNHCMAIWFFKCQIHWRRTNSPKDTRSVATKSFFMSYRFPQEETRCFRRGMWLKMIATGITMMRLQLPYNYLKIHNCTVAMPAYVMARKFATFIIIYNHRIIDRSYV